MRLFAPPVIGFSFALAAALSGCQGGSPVSPAASTQSASRSSLPAANSNARPFSVARLRPAQSQGTAVPPAWMRFAPAAGAGNAYVSQFNETYVNEYPANDRKNGPPICSISGEPYVNGIGVDSAHHLWVPSGGVNAGTTTEFAPHCGKALLHINDTDGQPGAIAFDSKGNIYIENIISASGPGNVDVYAPGTTKPKTMLQDSGAFRWFDEAFDASDDLFVIYADAYNKGHVIEFAHARGVAKALPMQLGFPGGVTFDSAGNLLVVDQDAVDVSVYKPPFTGKAIAAFRLKSDSVPCRFAMGKTLLYCADFTRSSVDVYRYDVTKPASTVYLYSFTNGITPGSAAAGIALDPAPPN